MNIILLLLISITMIYAQEEIPVDTLLINQEKMLENQEKLLEEIIYLDPLEGKKFGIEFNPMGFVMSTTRSDGFSIRGGVSLFPSSMKAEIAFPIYYNSDIHIFNINTGVRVFQIDGQYRGFIGKYRKGFYFSSGLRYISMEGDFSGDDKEFGLTFGIGYRIYGQTGWYWGTSIYGGRYLTEDQAILEIELLKFGILF